MTTATDTPALGAAMPSSPWPVFWVASIAAFGWWRGPGEGEVAVTLRAAAAAPMRPRSAALNSSPLSMRNSSDHGAVLSGNRMRSCGCTSPSSRWGDWSRPI